MTVDPPHDVGHEGDNEHDDSCPAVHSFTIFHFFLAL